MVDFPLSLLRVLFFIIAVFFPRVEHWGLLKLPVFVFHLQLSVFSLVSFILLVIFACTTNSQDCQYPQKTASRGRATTVLHLHFHRAFGIR